LFIMALARVLPRLWDAPRLMRFLAGLALLALAFAAQAGLTSPAPVAPDAPATAVVTTVDVPANPAAVSEQPAEIAPIVEIPRITVDEPVPVVDAVVPAHRPWRAHGSRGPPLI
jgi:hypothetical protein